MPKDRASLLLLQKEQTWNQEEWIVPLSTALEGLSDEQAAWQPPGGGNTIRETVNHLNYYNGRNLNRLSGIAGGPQAQSNEATFENQAGQADHAELAWDDLFRQTAEIAAGLREAIARLTEDDLNKPVGEITLGEHLASWLLHDAYHAGQIVLIRKQQGSWRS